MSSKIDQAVEELKILIRARYPIIYIQSDEKEMDIVKEVLKICIFGTKSGSEGRNRFQKKLIHWDIVNGFTTPAVSGNAVEWRSEAEGNADPVQALQYIQDGSKGEDQLFILSEFHHFLSDLNVQRRLRIFCQTVAVSQRKMIIILSPKNDGMSGTGKMVPTELENIIHIFSWPYPDTSHIRKVLVSNFIPNLNEGLENAGFDKMVFDEEGMKELVDACKGMTVSQIDNATSKSVVRFKKLIPSEIAKEKKQIIKKSGLCEYIEPDQKLSDIGGNDVFKEWLKKRKVIQSEDAYKFGCDLPKGVLLLGPWGSGKSSAAKAVINEWKIPGIRVDASKIYSMYVGQSEKRINDILSLAESVSPCVSGDTRILFEDGSLEKIENLFDNSVCHNKNDDFEIRKYIYKKRICSLSDKGELLPVTPQYITRKNKTGRIVLKNRYSVIKCTEDHLISLLDEEGNIIWKKAKDVDNNDYMIVCNKTLSIDDEVENINNYIIDRAIIGKKCRGFYLKSSINEKCYKNTKETIIPTEFNNEIFYLLGLLISDGYILKNGRGIGFVNSDKVLINEFKKLISKNFGKNINFIESLTTKDDMSEASKVFLKINENSKIKDCFHISVNNVILNYFFKKISDNIEKFKEEYIVSYLCGYLDGDGTIRKNINEPLIVFCNKGPIEERENIQNLLLKIGVHSAISKKGIEISSKINCSLLSDKMLPLYLIKKQIKNKRLIDISKKSNSRFNDRNDVVFIPHLLSKMCMELPFKKDLIAKKIGGNFYEYCSGLRAIPRFRLNIFFQEYKMWLTNFEDKLKFILDKNNVFCICKKTELKEETGFVYDIVNSNHSEISERNFIANNSVIHNCVLWWDEIENLLSGDQGPNDGGASSRVVGIISTWMAEHEGMVFNIFTANDISGRPPKLFRKGRLDEIFIIDLPAQEERIDILKIHVNKRLERRGRNESLDSIDYDLISEQTYNFSGSELEAAINSAFIECYTQGDKTISTEHVLKAVKETIPMSQTMREEIIQIRKWQEGRAIRASIYPPENIMDSSFLVNQQPQKQIDIME